MNIRANKDLAMVQSIMQNFATRTGLTGRQSLPKRYLWTDAFAVCNFLELHRQSGDEEYLALALNLIDQVHHVLGRFSQSDDRAGWISGLNEANGEKHPTRGGLRIGKALPERRVDEAFDERLEWERDGQYFHYLTRWMHALDCVARHTGEVHFNHWAIELAQAAFDGFTRTDTAGGERRMVWKMSVDLSRPQVPSMGQHDALDGLLTFMTLKASAEAFGEVPATLDLSTQITELAGVCEGMAWATQDSLGIGGLLTDICRLAQLVAVAALSPETRSRETERLTNLMSDAQHSLVGLVESNVLSAPADYRLAFRELGLSIGLQGLLLIYPNLNRDLPEHREAFLKLDALLGYADLAERIEAFWLEPEHRQAATWKDHIDINSVMLATSLAPHSYLDIRSRKEITH